MTKVEVRHAKNGLDFSVVVWREGRAPQILNNLPVNICLERCGCTADEIANHVRID